MDRSSVKSYAKDMCFGKRELMFLNIITASENRHLRCRILDVDLDIDSIVAMISDEIGYDPIFVKKIISDMRCALDSKKQFKIYVENKFEADGLFINEMKGCISAKIINQEDNESLDPNMTIISDYSYCGGKYTGGFKNKPPNGFGKLIYSRGKYYEGDFVEGVMTGRGKYFWSSGNHYEGEFVNNKMTGKGKYTWASGYFYEGDFLNDKRTGKGKYFRINGDRYEGDFIDGKRIGKGKYIWGLDSKWAGDRYEGDFIDGIFIGEGFYFSSNGNCCEGYFVDGKMTGNGKLSWHNGDFLNVLFEDDTPNGLGEYHRSDGRVFKGMFIDWNVPKTGYLTVDGNTYEGNITNGMFEGKAIVINTDITISVPLTFQGMIC